MVMSDGNETPAPPRSPLWRRLLWFGGLWLAGVAAIGTIAYLIRVWLA